MRFPTCGAVALAVGLTSAWCNGSVASKMDGSDNGITPYTAFAWTAPDVPLVHVVGLIRYQSNSDPAAVAAALNQHPRGQRFLLRWESNDNRFWHHPQDQLAAPVPPTTRPANGDTVQGPWADHGAAAEAAFESRFAAALQQHCASPDFLVLDTEMGVNTFQLQPDQLRAIVADPRWPPLARQFGVRSTDRLLGPLTTADSQAFNLAMQVTTGQCVRAGYVEPWLKCFPHLHCSDFGDGLLDASQARQAIDDNGIVQPMAAPMHGDTQSPCCYAWVHQLLHSPDNQSADFTQPLPTLCWVTSMVRAYARSTPPILPWIAARSWTDGHVVLLNTPFQDELLWHVCLSAGCTSVLLFNPDSPPADNVVVDHDLAQLQTLTGGSQSLVPLTFAAVRFDSIALVSGARCVNGHRVYRVTVESADKGGRLMRVVLPGDSAATQVQIEPGQLGAWVVR